MMVEHPTTEKKFFFIDQCLPFGPIISCAIFQDFSDAIMFITEQKMGIFYAITNYLDDYLFVACTIRKCNELLKKFLYICFMLGVPISAEKMVWGTDLITFLGFLLDGKNFRLTIPEEKRLKAVNSLEKMLVKRKATVKELQQLAGFLNFLNHAIVPGRTFTRCMYTKYADTLEAKSQSKPRKLKHYHHIKLDQEFKRDCQVWLEFLKVENVAAVSRPFVDFSKEVAATTFVVGKRGGPKFLGNTYCTKTEGRAKTTYSIN